MTMVLINDFVVKKRIKLYFTTEEFKRIKNVWQSTDKLLVELQSTDAFAGKTRWCDLSPAHYRFLIEQNLILIETDDDLSNSVTMESLNFLLCSLIYCIELNLDANLEVLKISRVAMNEVSFEVTATLQIENRPRGTMPFSIVVDNT